MQGHTYSNMTNWQIQNMLLRGIAWAGHHPVDELVDYPDANPGPGTPIVPPVETGERAAAGRPSAGAPGNRG
jgi:hypothetical protein